MQALRTTFLPAIALIAIAACARDAHADGPSLHLSAGGARAVGGAQQTEFGPGGGGALAGELPVNRVLGVELELSALSLAAGSAPGPRFAQPSAGVGLGSMLGVRVRPFGATSSAGIYLDAHAGVIYTGNVARPSLDAQIGYDLRVGGSGRWEVGPFVGFTEIVETSSAVVPDDAHILWVGIQVALGAPEKKAPPSVREDVVQRERPPSDRDHAVVAEAYTCQSGPGLHECLRLDSDNDTVLDDEDACPDVPGLPTDSPLTRGCPAPHNDVHLAGDTILLGDIIHFDLDSPRVRRASWSIVRNIAEFLDANPDIREIDVEGHADQTGMDDHNMALSGERAAAVKRLLLRYGVSGDRVTTHAFGQSRPRAPGRSVEAFRENRRVEFVVTRAQARASAPSVASSDSSRSAFNTAGEQQ